MKDAIRFRAGEDILTAALPSVDGRILGAVAMPARPINAIHRVFFGAYADRPATIARAELLGAVSWALDLVEKDLELLSYRYGFRIESAEARLRDGIEMIGGSGGMGGFRMNGDSYHDTIWANVAECRLDKWGTDERGRGVLVEATDIRPLRRLETDNFGPVAISRRRLGPSLPETLRGLRDFVASHLDDPIGLSYPLWRR